MRVESGGLPGMLIFTPNPIVDERGHFSRTFDATVARDAGLDPAAFVQDSQSRSRLGVIRGLHVRAGKGEAKVVRCSYGAVFDVVVDVRPGSDTFGRWVSVRLDDIDHRSVYIPAGCAHGFQALTEPADICYRIDQPHDPAYDLTIRWDDEQLAVAWPLPVTMVSERDRAGLPMRELLDRLG
jgi:dTDP-4-dehydrorhamnose 3,5-epimerase